MSLKRGDFVKIKNKSGIVAEVLGFYAHTQDVRVKTTSGHEWIVSPLHLEKLDGGAGVQET